MVAVLIKLTLNSCFLFSKAKQKHFKEEVGAYYDLSGFNFSSVYRIKALLLPLSLVQFEKILSKTSPETCGCNCYPA